MVSTFIISLREYLEVFLIIGVFLGISKKLKIKKEKEIIFAILLGIIISIFLPILVFVFSSQAAKILTEKSAEFLESYLMIFSGFFIAYVVFSLHKFFVLNRSKTIIKSHQKLQKNIFDISLFLTIIFFVVREGFEIALFTATTSLFYKFIENFSGLILGFFVSSAFGILTYFGFSRFSINKIYKLTEFLIIVLGASLVKNGVSELLELYFNIDLKDIFVIKLNFLPSQSTFLGHLIKNNFGLQQDYSLIMLFIMISYFLFVKFLFLSKK
jgi:high-affinity iron transporter